MLKSDFKILNRLDIDDAKWNNCIEKSTSLVYPNSWYLDVVSPAWKAIIYKDYEAVFPLTWRKKIGITYLFQPFFTQQLGLFCIDKSLYSEIISEIILILKSNFKHINIHFNHHFTRELNQRNNFELPLKNQIEKQKKYYSTQTKRNLKKAIKNDLEIKDNIDYKEIISLFQKSKGTEIDELKNEDYNTLIEICNTVKNNIDIESISVIDKNELISGGIFFKSHNRLTMIMLASNSDGKKVAASTLLIDHIIKKYSKSKLILDFEGSQIESLARFYQGFGSLNRVYATFSHSLIPFKK